MLLFFEKAIIVFDLFKKLLIFKKLLTFEKLLTIKEFLISRELLISFKSFNKTIIAFNVFDNKKTDVIINLNIIKILRQCLF